MVMMERKRFGKLLDVIYLKLGTVVIRFVRNQHNNRKNSFFFNNFRIFIGRGSGKLFLERPDVQTTSVSLMVDS